MGCHIDGKDRKDMRHDASAHDERSRQAIELTSLMMHRHYCDNDIDGLTCLFDDPFSWLGAGESEYGVGHDHVKRIFEDMDGKVPRCEISDERYDAIRLADDIYIVSGMMWIQTDSSTNVFVRVHQRITAAIRWVDGQARCAHIHISNPYVEMAPDEVGFPTKVARHTYEYMQEQIDEARHLIARQTEELASIYNTVPCAIIRLLRDDEGYHLLTSNKALCDILGTDENGIVSLDWRYGHTPNVDEEDRPRIREALARLHDPGDISHVDYTLHSASGKPVVLNTTNLFVGRSPEGDIIQRIGFDITSRVEMERALEQMGYVDMLTGVHNRNRFTQLLAKSHDGGRPLGIAYFDINGLKAVNDRMGHAAGDQLIVRTAQHLDSRFEGKTYRIGGDEFVVVDSDRDEAAFRAAIEDVRSAMTGEGILVAVGISFTAHGGDLRTQFDEADRLMYQEKKRFYAMDPDEWVYSRAIRRRLYGSQRID